MSTVTPTLIDEGDAYDAAAVNSAVQGITDGLNAMVDDDFAHEGFGHQTAHAPVVNVGMPANAFQAITTGTVVIAGAYPGFGVLTGWTAVTIATVDVKVVPTAPFEVGPNSPEKIGSVLIGATFHADIVTPATDEAHLAFGIKHTGIAQVDPIPETDFRVAADDVWSQEYILTENDVPAGETLEEIWLMAVGPQNVTIGVGQIWAIPLHSEG